MLGGKKKDWVCEDKDCNRPICSDFHAYEESISQLEQAKQNLKAAEAQLSESVAEPPLLAANEMMLAMAKERVEDRKTILAMAKTILATRCSGLTRSHEIIKEVLIHGKAAGNKTDHKTLYTNRSAIEAELEELDNKTENKGPRPPSPSSCLPPDGFA